VCMAPHVRAHVQDVFTMSILHAPNKAELLRKGVDPLADAWCGVVWTVDHTQAMLPSAPSE
jgi:hypothetical protein